MFESIKVLLASNFPNPDSFEGIWMDILEGNPSNGIGILNNEPFGVTDCHVGDIVRYRTINMEQKPYIIGRIPLHTIMISNDELALVIGQWHVNTAEKRIALKAEIKAITKVLPVTE